jgi:hypothetical protein
MGLSSLVECNDPLKTCTGHSFGEINYEYDAEDHIKRWTAKLKAALVMEIIQGKTTISEASRSFDWTSLGVVDKLEPQIEARSNASGLTPPKWLWRLEGM